MAASLGVRARGCGVGQQVQIESLVEELGYYRPLVERAIWQARERVLEGVPVQNREKLFSLFEPHTELLIRGKAGKNIEFGHMIEIRQVEQKFITGYDVFSRKPKEPGLLAPAVREHERLFGTLPGTLAADKEYWAGSEEIRKLEEKIPTVSVAKKGKRNEKEAAREADPFFRHAQRFRAGVEGTISFLKPVLGLTRCFNRGWEHYSSTVGFGIFAHNLLILARC